MWIIHPRDAVLVSRIEIAGVATGLGAWYVGDKLHKRIYAIAALVGVNPRKRILKRGAGVCGDCVAGRRRRSSFLMTKMGLAIRIYNEPQ